MKIRSNPSILLLAAAAVALAVSPARAALTYNSGDLFLGFRGTGAAQDFLVNIGNVSQFAALSPGSTVSVDTGGSISASLVTAFGAGWFSSGEVFWSISGTPYDGGTVTTPTVFATRARPSANVQSVPWTGRSEFGQTASVSDLQALALKYQTEGAAAGGTKGTFQDAASNNSYAFFTSQNSDFRLGGSIEGTPGAVLDFYQINAVAGQQATYLGTFTLNNSGAVQFTAAAVPEPSTASLIGVFAVGIILYLRRRSRNV